MKTISVAREAYLRRQITTDATCLLVTWVDGTLKGFTDHDLDIVFDGVTYYSTSGYDPSDVATASDLNVDNLEVVGLTDATLSHPSITEDDLVAGRWDFAEFRIFRVDWNDLTHGKETVRRGKFGEVTLERAKFKAELRGMMQFYTTSLGRMESPACNADLGDARCGVRLDPPIWEDTTAYTVVLVGDAAIGSIVSPSVYNGRIFACTTAGTSGGSEPTWNTTLDGTTADGSVVWTTRLALTAQGTVDDVSVDQLTIYDAARDEDGPTDTRAVSGVTNANPGVVSYASAFDPPLVEGEAVILSGIVGPSSINVLVVVRSPGETTFELAVDTSDTTDYPPYVSGGTVSRFADSGFFDGGVLRMVGSGNANLGLAREVKAYVPGQITLHLPFPEPIVPGVSYELVAGCDKSFPTCRDRFENAFNNRGLPYLPGTDKIVQVGRHS